MAELLKECPWCAGTDTLIYYDYDLDDVLRGISVCCSCGASGPNTGSDEDATAAWNDLSREITSCRTALAPILAHASAHDYAPPLKYSVAACREMLRAINGND